MRIKAIFTNEYLQVVLLLGGLLCLFFGENLFWGKSLFLEIKKDIATAYQAYPGGKFSRELFRSGYFPLWNPYSALGLPHLASPITDVIFPLKILIYLFPLIPALDLVLLIRIFIVGFLTYLFARSIGLDRGGSILAAISFMLCGYFMRYLNMYFLNVDICIPLLLWAGSNLMEGKRPGGILLVGVGVCLCVIGGNPGATFYALFFAGSWVLFKIFSDKRVNIYQEAKQYSFLFGGALVLGLFLSAILLLPFTEYFGRSWHFLHQTGTGSSHLNIKYIISFVLSWWYGDNSNSTIDTYALIPYVGIIPFTLALFTLINFRRSNRSGAFFAGFIITFMGIVFGLPIFNLVGSLPIFDLLLNWKYPVPAISFSVAILAGMGLSSLRRRNFLRRYFYASLSITSLLIIGFFLAHLLGLLQTTNERYILFQSGSGLLWLALIAGIFALYHQGWCRSSVFATLIVIIVSLGLWVDNRGNRPLYQEEFRQQRDHQFFKILQKDREVFRFYAPPEIFIPNLAMLYSLNDIRASDVLIVRDFFSFVAFINKISESELQGYVIETSSQFRPGVMRSRLFDLLNLKYIISSRGLSSRQIVDEFLVKGEIITRDGRYVHPERFTIGLNNKGVLLEHPPAKIEIPLIVASEGASLQFALALNPYCWLPERGDGVGFAIDLTAERKTERIFFRYIDPKRNQQDRKWHPIIIDLNSYLPVRNLSASQTRQAGTQTDRGRQILLSFITEPGPKGENSNDWAGWGDLRIDEPKDDKKYELISDRGDHGVKIYKNKDAFPRAFIVPEVEIVEEHEEVLKRMNSESFDLRKVIILEEQVPELRLTANNAQVIRSSRADIIDYQANKVEIETRMAGEGFLVLSDTYYPGWKAYVDRREERIYRADYLLRAIHLSPGFHKVKFIFDPLSFKFGLWLTLTTSFGLAEYLIYFLWRVRIRSAKSPRVAIRKEKSIRTTSNPPIL
jgi:hypothetical protein